MAFEGTAELFDALGVFGVVGGAAVGGGGGFHEVAVVFAGEAFAFAVEDEDGVDFGEEGREGAAGGHGCFYWSLALFVFQFVWKHYDTLPVLSYRITKKILTLKNFHRLAR